MTAGHPKQCDVASNDATGIEIHVRIARPTDALCLSALAMQVFLDTYATDGIRPSIARVVMDTFSEGEFKTHLCDPDTTLLVAEAGQHLVGFAQITFNASHELSPQGRQSELLRLYVQERFTSRQIGTMLLSAAERIAEARGTDFFWLTPWVHNHRAIAFYQRRGYSDYGLTYFTFDGERHENRLYAKRLT